MTTNNNEYFAIKMTKEGPVPEKFNTSKKAREAALEHFNTKGQNAVVGRVGAKSFSILGKKVNNVADFTGVLNESNFQTFDQEVTLITAYYAYCRDDHKRVSGRYSTKKEAQQKADEHYLETGGPNGGHYVIVETIVKG